MESCIAATGRATGWRGNVSLSKGQRHRSMSSPTPWELPVSFHVSPESLSPMKCFSLGSLGLCSLFSENWKYFYPERCFICDLERGVMLRMLEEGCNCWIVVMGSFPLAILISEGEVWHLFYFPAELCPLCFCGDFLRQCQHLCESEWDTWEWMSVALTERSDKSHESKMMKLQLLLFDL